jgi:hypothetical protein
MSSLEVSCCRYSQSMPFSVVPMMDLLVLLLVLSVTRCHLWVSHWMPQRRTKYLVCIGLSVSRAACASCQGSLSADSRSLNSLRSCFVLAVRISGVV